MPRQRDKAYVSDFAHFMDDFLDHHPEVVDDQRRGWSIYWNHELDINEQEKAGQDAVPVGAYYYFDMTPPAPAKPGGHGPADDQPPPAQRPA